ncbi:EAL domain-containing protein [Aquincola sp. S2]|uniref:EAL domain-containing protein n=1 Tax=Pseudaquabacterium terrae TaxID=2732868 RepID=A0ABX2ET33_9BURK|nr:EAL domain-containing protein [Aquabacterium terrae]NRF71802.1 EAL domain-containing protein [Aquabacterium terrae]
MHPPPRLGRVALPLIVLVTGIALSLFIGIAAQQEIERGANERFDAVAMDLARKVEGRFDDYTAVLRGLQARFNTEHEISREDFRDYVAGLKLDKTYPGFQAVNFAAYRRGPPADRYMLTFIEPLAGNEHLVGRDLGAMPNRGNALEQSRDTGGLASSGRRIRIGNRDADIGLAMRLPVYRPNLPLNDVEQRRSAYQGSVGAGFCVATMMRDVMGHGAPATRRLRLIDAGPGPGPIGTRSESRFVSANPADQRQLLFDSHPAPPPAAAAASAGAAAVAASAGTAAVAAVDPHRIERTLRFELGGHSWLVEVSDDPRVIVGRIDRAIWWLLIAAGSVISALLAGIVFSLATARGRAQALATAMTQHLRSSERQLEEAQRLANLGSWILETRTGALQCSDQARTILGLDDGVPADLRSLLARIPAAERAGVELKIAEASSTSQRTEFEHHLGLADGSERWLHVIVEPTQEGEHTLLRGVVRDDTQRLKSALRLKLEHEIAGLLLTDGEPKVVIARALEVVCQHFRWDCGALWRVREDAKARCLASWHGPGSAALDEFVRISRTLEYQADEGSLGRAWGQGEAVRVDGLVGREDFTRDALAGRAGLVVGLVVPIVAAGTMTALEFFSRDPRAGDADALETLRTVALQIAQYEHRKHAEQRLRYVANHDALTGLHNRASLQRELARAIKRSNRHRKRFAVMFIDLDRFKHINDTLGHGVGDMMIRVCGERLTTLLREDDTVARFGGDEFVLLLENLSDAGDAAVLAKKALGCFAEPFAIEGHELHISASIGISVYPEDGADAETLVKNADTAMYQAKDKGRGTYRFYAAQMNAQSAERLILESGLRRALVREELLLHYQPKLDLKTQRIVGVEALMRWRHPTLGMISPAQFIPIAEETGLIEAMGQWALRQACSDAVAWRRQGLPALQMSVNLSPRQLGSRTLISEIATILDESGLEPELLELEITEGAVMKNAEQAVTVLETIRGMGIGLAIDDFGTGYSSLSYLRRFPLSTVKIDRSFIHDLSEDTDAQALTDSIITLAHGLRMQVVAEGVETMTQLDHLRSRGCDVIQGYLLSRPLPAEELCRFVGGYLHHQIAAPIAA